MRDRVPIVCGLLVFVALFTFPVWRGLASGTLARQPELKLPVSEKHCVAPVEYMRRSHMQLLLDWREAAVRQGQRTFTAYDGKKYDISLTQTCLGQCHTERRDFCDRCHTYAGVSGPYCFDCHQDRVPKVATLADPRESRIPHLSAQNPGAKVGHPNLNDSALALMRRTR